MHIDKGLFYTAELYVSLTNEEPVGEALFFKFKVVVATKFGFELDPNGGEICWIEQQTRAY